MNASRFDGKHVLITGAARGIGFEIAKQFAAEGAVLSLFDSNVENLTDAEKQLAASAKNRVYTYTVDIATRTNVISAVEDAESRQPVDVLVNNAGIAFETPFLNIEEAEWKKIMDVNLTGFFYVSQAVCRYMARRKTGVVVNMASKNGLDGEFGYAHYNASKAGVVMLTKTMALELAHVNIRVNAVCPGYIQTPMSMEIDPPEFVESFVEKYIPLNRPGRVGDVAPLFLFLASEESGFITGQTFVADGGQLAGQKPWNGLLEKMKM